MVTFRLAEGVEGCGGLEGSTHTNAGSVIPEHPPRVLYSASPKPALRQRRASPPYCYCQYLPPLYPLQWLLRVHPLSGWRPGWYGGLVAAVVLVSMALSGLTLALLLSR